MLSIDDSYEDLLVINKSKFFAFAIPVFDEEIAKEKISEFNKKYSDATHVCFAYVLSSPRVEKASDDGEPTGTAGKPMLELLKKRNLENILVVVVRYFGGIKLGAGGLVRAYTNASNLVLNKANIVTYIQENKYIARINVSDGARLVSVINNLGGRIDSCKYSDFAEIEFVGEITSNLESIFKDIEIEKIGSEFRCQ